MPSHQRTRRKIHHAVYAQNAFDHPWVGQEIAWTSIGTQRGNSFNFSEKGGKIILWIPANVPPRVVWEMVQPVAPRPYVFPDVSCKDRFMVMQPSDRNYLRTIDQFLLPYCSALTEDNLLGEVADRA
jgi:hypothetical protein